MHEGYAYPHQFRHPYDTDSQWEQLHAVSIDVTPIHDLLPNRYGNIFTAHDFDLRTAISTAGRVLEVGGPSYWGYEIFEGVRFPSRPIISNRLPESFIITWNDDDERTETLGPIDIDLRADARSLPFIDTSLDLIMASGLDNVSKDLKRKLQTEHGSLAYEQAHELEQETYRFDTLMLIGKVAAGEPIGTFPEAAVHSPRTGLLLEAMRLLKPNGLLVLAFPTQEDIWLAEALGFEMQAHTRLLPGSQLPREVVFQKPRAD